MSIFCYVDNPKETLKAYVKYLRMTGRGKLPYIGVRDQAWGLNGGKAIVRWVACSC